MARGGHHHREVVTAQTPSKLTPRRDDAVQRFHKSACLMSRCIDFLDSGISKVRRPSRRRRMHMRGQDAIAFLNATVASRFSLMT